MSRFFNSSVLVFVAIIVLIVGWIGSGALTRDEVAPPAPPERKAPAVGAAWSEAQRIERILSLYGEVEPQQIAVVRARTSGIVEEVAVRRGAFVEAGDRLAQLSLDDRPARLARAEAELAAAQRDFDAAAELLERGTGTEAAERTARAQLEAARSALEAIEQELALTELTAPIAGIVNRIISDVGAVVTIGADVVEIIDNNPLIAVVQVPQYAIGRISVGGPARVSFTTENTREGVVRFVAPIADAATRTFRVEIEIDNPGRDLPSGLSVSVEIPTEEVLAHLVSPALATLDEAGNAGLQAVDEEGRVEFYPIEIVRAEARGVWVTGLPERVRLITIRQAPVSVGQQVAVRESPPGFGLTPPGPVDSAPETTVGQEGPAGGVLQ